MKTIDRKVMPLIEIPAEGSFRTLQCRAETATRRLVVDDKNPPSGRFYVLYTRNCTHIRRSECTIENNALVLHDNHARDLRQAYILAETDSGFSQERVNISADGTVSVTMMGTYEKSKAAVQRAYDSVAPVESFVTVLSEMMDAEGNTEGLVSGPSRIARENSDILKELLWHTEIALNKLGILYKENPHDKP